MRVLFDTNVVLDLLLDRQPFSEAAAALFSEVEKGNLTGLICATSITTVYYLVNKAAGRKKADECVELLTSLLEVAAVNRRVIETARELHFKDFEDAVIYASALHSAAKAVITRNLKDFPQDQIPAFSPEKLLKVLKSAGS